MLDLSAFDDGYDALSRHLPWDCFVWPGVVLLEEDGALMAVVEYGGRDQSAQDPAEIQQAAMAAGNVLFPFTGGWTFHFEMQRRFGRGYPRGTGVHPVSELIDAERRARLDASGRQLRTRSLVAITHTPMRRSIRRVASWFTRNPPKRARPDVMRDHVEPFRQLVLRSPACSAAPSAGPACWVTTRSRPSCIPASRRSTSPASWCPTSPASRSRPT